MLDENSAGHFLIEGADDLDLGVGEQAMREESTLWTIRETFRRRFMKSP